MNVLQSYRVGKTKSGRLFQKMVPKIIFNMEKFGLHNKRSAEMTESVLIYIYI